jgi:hypothetical protein
MLGEATEFNPVGKIERGLGFFMRPVEPDPDFVQKLGSRLRVPKNVTLEGGAQAKPAALLLLLAGLIVGILSLLLLRRIR